MPVADTVGCGDSFGAAIVLGFTRGHDMAPVLALANAVGAATAMGTGAGRNVASPALVMDLLRREVRFWTPESPCDARMMVPQRRVAGACHGPAAPGGAWVKRGTVKTIRHCERASLFTCA